MLTDWTRKMAAEFEPGTTEGPLKVDNILIDGLGCDTNQNKTNCDVIPIPVYYMEYDKCHRWRIDNSANQNCALEFTVSELKLKVRAHIINKFSFRFRNIT